MNHQASDKKFIFNENIDKDFLFSLYEEDYPYMLEVFSTSLESLEEDSQSLHLAYKSGDFDQVKRAVHKLKPVFGFTGLLVLQDAISHFEKACMHHDSGVEPLKIQYEHLLQQIREGQNIIEQESKRLRQFTGITV